MRSELPKSRNMCRGFYLQTYNGKWAVFMDSSAGSYLGRYDDEEEAKSALIVARCFAGRDPETGELVK